MIVLQQKIPLNIVRGIFVVKRKRHVFVAFVINDRKKEKSPKQESAWGSHLAERKGFEPLKRYQRLHDFQSCALDQLSHLSVLYLL